MVLLLLPTIFVSKTSIKRKTPPKRRRKRKNFRKMLSVFTQKSCSVRTGGVFKLDCQPVHAHQSLFIHQRSRLDHFPQAKIRSFRLFELLFFSSSSYSAGVVFIFKCAYFCFVVKTKQQKKKEDQRFGIIRQHVRSFFFFCFKFDSFNFALFLVDKKKKTSSFFSA